MTPSEDGSSARVYVNGKRVRGRRLRAPVDLRGLPKGRYTVKVVAVTTTGRKVVSTRTYRTCVARDRRSRQPRPSSGRTS